MVTCAAGAAAHEDETASGMVLDEGGLAPIRADSHAPIGVMGDHMHKAGEWMLSYRYKHMHMEGNLIGKDGVAPTTIATTVPNMFFGQPGQPPTLRIVPLEMDMDMHMFGGMYAPTDWLTLMAMVNYVEKDMDLVTYQGPAGTTELGNFTTRSEGFGDTSVSGMIRLYDDGTNHLHFNIGLSLPTGSLKETDQILAPTGATPIVRLPYAMQLGSGTWDILPGLTYTGHAGAFGWGAQYSAIVRTGENSQNYSLGNVHRLTGWASYEWASWISTSVRLAGESVGKIDGRDAAIVGPVQTANPDFYGGKTADVLFGVNLAGQDGWLRGQRLAVEFGLPVYQDLNGPQMERDYQLILGYQIAF
jgi:hypothetical protein